MMLIPQDALGRALAQSETNGRMVTAGEVVRGALDPCEHEWELGLLGTGTETCRKCKMGPRTRAPRENPEEEKRLQYAEEGFRNAANEIASDLLKMSKAERILSDQHITRHHVLKSAADHARLIGKGRDGT